ARQPEGACDESAFRSGKTISTLRGIIAKHKAVPHEMLLYCCDRPLHPGIGGWEESKVRNHQHTRIESFAAIRLGERSHPRVEAAPADLRVDSIPQRVEVRQHLLALIATESKLLDSFRDSIEKYPGHDFRMGEVSPSAPHFPNTVVGALPGIFHESDQILSHLPAFHPRGHAHLKRHVPRRQGFSIDVELELARSGVTHAYGLRAF